MTRMEAIEQELEEYGSICTGDIVRLLAVAKAAKQAHENCFTRRCLGECIICSALAALEQETA